MNISEGKFSHIVAHWTEYTENRGGRNHRSKCMDAQLIWAATVCIWHIDLFSGCRSYLKEGRLVIRKQVSSTNCRQKTNIWYELYHFAVFNLFFSPNMRQYAVFFFCTYRKEYSSIQNDSDMKVFAFFLTGGFFKGFGYLDWS